MTAPQPGDTVRVVAHSQVLKWPMTAPVMDFYMPEGSTVIDVRTQNNVPTLWTLSPVGPPSAAVKRTFIGFGTGHLIGEDKPLTYVGSAHDIDGWMVFHIFERATA